MKNVGKGVKPKRVRHAGLEHALENDGCGSENGCGSEKLLKNRPSVVDDRSCCKELFLLLEENVCCRTLVCGTNCICATKVGWQAAEGTGWLAKGTR